MDADDPRYRIAFAVAVPGLAVAFNDNRWNSARLNPSARPRLGSDGVVGVIYVIEFSDSPPMEENEKTTFRVLPSTKKTKRFRSVFLH